MIDFLILIVIGLILGLAGGYVYRARKKGVKCIGCPDGAACSGKCGGCCGCNHGQKTE